MGTMKTFSFGACAIAGYSPSKQALGPDTKVFNIKVKFEEGLKLNLALDECLRKLNRYKMSTSKGKKAAVNLALHLDNDRLTIMEAAI